MTYPHPPAPPNYRRVNHMLHLVLSLLTLGGWALFVWWWWAIVVMVQNSALRAGYERDQARYDEAVRELHRRQQGPPPPPAPPWWHDER